MLKENNKDYSSIEEVLIPIAKFNKSIDVLDLSNNKISISKKIVEYVDITSNNFFY